MRPKTIPPWIYFIAVGIFGFLSGYSWCLGRACCHCTRLTWPLPPSASPGRFPSVESFPPPPSGPGGLDTLSLARCGFFGLPPTRCRSLSSLLFSAPPPSSNPTPPFFSFGLRPLKVHLPAQSDQNLLQVTTFEEHQDTSCHSLSLGTTLIFFFLQNIFQTFETSARPAAAAWLN